MVSGPESMVAWFQAFSVDALEEAANSPGAT
jgi:hypothetical protein